jgi:hypothetical protein
MHEIYALWPYVGGLIAAAFAVGLALYVDKKYEQTEDGS